MRIMNILLDLPFELIANVISFLPDETVLELYEVAELLPYLEQIFTIVDATRDHYEYSRFHKYPNYVNLSPDLTIPKSHTHNIIMLMRMNNYEDHEQNSLSELLIGGTKSCRIVVFDRKIGLSMPRSSQICNKLFGLSWSQRDMYKKITFLYAEDLELGEYNRESFLTSNVFHKNLKKAEIVSYQQFDFPKLNSLRVHDYGILNKLETCISNFMGTLRSLKRLELRNIYGLQVLEGWDLPSLEDLILDSSTDLEIIMHMNLPCLKNFILTNLSALRIISNITFTDLETCVLNLRSISKFREIKANSIKKIIFKDSYTSEDYSAGSRARRCLLESAASNSWETEDADPITVACSSPHRGETQYPLSKDIISNDYCDLDPIDMSTTDSETLTLENWEIEKQVGHFKIYSDRKIVRYWQSNTFFRRITILSPKSKILDDDGDCSEGCEVNKDTLSQYYSNAVGHLVIDFSLLIEYLKLFDFNLAVFRTLKFLEINHDFSVDRPPSYRFDALMMHFRRAATLTFSNITKLRFRTTIDSTILAKKRFDFSGLNGLKKLNSLELLVSGFVGTINDGCAGLYCLEVYNFGIDDLEALEITAEPAFPVKINFSVFGSGFYNISYHSPEKRTHSGSQSLFD